MTVKTLSEQLDLRTVAAADTSREVTGGYAGDLLSWVMGRAKEGCAWVTIMANPNVVAVASLADVAAVIIAEGSDIPSEVAALAKEKGINMFASPLPSFELCAAISRLI